MDQLNLVVVLSVLAIVSAQAWHDDTRQYPRGLTINEWGGNIIKLEGLEGIKVGRKNYDFVARYANELMKILEVRQPAEKEERILQVLSILEEMKAMYLRHKQTAIKNLRNSNSEDLRLNRHAMQEYNIPALKTRHLLSQRKKLKRHRNFMSKAGKKRFGAFRKRVQKGKEENDEKLESTTSLHSVSQKPGDIPSMFTLRPDYKAKLRKMLRKHFGKASL